MRVSLYFFFKKNYLHLRVFCHDGLGSMSDLGSEGFGDLLACIRSTNIILQNNIHFVVTSRWCQSSFVTLLQFLGPADNMCSSCRHTAIILTRYGAYYLKLFCLLFVTCIFSDFLLIHCWCGASNYLRTTIFFVSLI